MLSRSDYLKTLNTRAKESRVYKKFQLIGLEISEILDDKAHKTLYIKLAKSAKNPETLLELAKRISERKNVRKKGAYFMKIVSLNKTNAQNSR